MANGGGGDDDGGGPARRASFLPAVSPDRIYSGTAAGARSAVEEGNGERGNPEREVRGKEKEGESRCAGR